MCRPVTCKKCGKTTWAGCGQHVNQVLARVPGSPAVRRPRKRPRRQRRQASQAIRSRLNRRHVTSLSACSATAPTGPCHFPPDAVRAALPARSRHDTVRKKRFFPLNGRVVSQPGEQGAAGDGPGPLAAAVIVRT